MRKPPQKNIRENEFIIRGLIISVMAIIFLWVAPLVLHPSLALSAQLITIMAAIFGLILIIQRSSNA